MSYTHESHLGIFSNQRRKKETKNNDWPGWISPQVEKSNGLGCLTLKLSLLMMFLFFYSMFSFSFEFDIIPFSIGLWLQTPIGVKYKLSISHSNSCIWQVAVRHTNAFQLSEDPSPSAVYHIPLPHFIQTNTTPPLQLRSLFPLLLDGASLA